ncbi:uncharacterized protein wu:fi37e09 isoform X2 [Danio rerio]|uniref:Uncharacterized protein wu:fi37e09 isoform X2 n=1 Tax=Danio rerio TaxID=7955 RepID=A0AC58IGH7_DANRE
MKNVLRTVMFAVIVCGVFSADEDKVKSVMEGESVTLNPDLTQMHGIIQKKWIFQKKGSTTTENIQYVEILKNRLKRNDQTESLTINNMRSKHSGIYILRIDLNTGPKDIRFTVNVEEVPSASDIYNIEMKNVSVTKGKPVILQTDITKLQGDELIVWRFGDEGKLLAKEDKETKSPPYYNTDERFRDRLQLNDQTGSLIISHTKDTDAGLYTVKINSNEHMTYKIITVAVTVPASGGSPGGIIVIVLLGIALAAAVVVAVCYCCKISKSRKPIDNISDQIKELPNICNDLKQLCKYYGLNRKFALLLKIAKKLEDVSDACDKDMLTVSKHLTQLHEEISKKLSAVLSPRTTSQADPGQDLDRTQVKSSVPEASGLLHEEAVYANERSNPV